MTVELRVPHVWPASRPGNALGSDPAQKRRQAIINGDTTRREFLPDLFIDVWGFNDSMPGPTIEVDEGDRVRIWVHNELPESTGIPWHGLEIPVAMDGVPGLTQPPLAPGETQAFEFTLHQDGTFFYHSHDGMQDGMGMVGLFIIHPRAAHEPRVDRDFALRIQPSAWVPGNTVLVAVAQVREIEFIANKPGDWMLHCHMFHHVMNFMSSMVGPMGGHMATGLRAGQPATGGMGIANGGPALSDAYGPSMGRAMGEQTSLERAVGTGPRAMGSAMAEGMNIDMNMNMMMPGMTMPMPGRDHGSASAHAAHGAGPGRRVPGYPQGMMDMPMEMPEAKLRKLNKRETRGMRHDWYTALEGLMTVVRVLPPDLYDAVMSGDAPVPAGASTPGGGPGNAVPHRHRN